MKKINSCFLVITIVFSLSFYYQKGNFIIVDSSQAREIVKENNDNCNFHIIDARKNSHFFKGHIPGAINIDPNDNGVVDILNELNKNDIYLIYCRTRKRIFALSNLMQEMGFQNIILMIDGWLVWEKAGFEKEIPPRE